MLQHISPLQDIVHKIIRQELEGSERRFNRITMSDDSSGNPAELYGSDGKIYYRKAGGSGNEIGISGGGDVYLASDNIFTGDHQTIRGAGGSSANYPTIMMKNTTFGAVDHPVAYIDDSGNLVIGSSDLSTTTLTDVYMMTNVNMNNKQLTGLAEATVNGNAVRYEEVNGVYLELAGGVMTGNLSMGVNDVQLDSGVLRMSNGTGLSGSVGFTTGVQNYIQRQLISGSNYTLLSDQDYMHTWAILGTEKMHLSTADGLKLFTSVNMNTKQFTSLGTPTIDLNAATKKYVDDNMGDGTKITNCIDTVKVDCKSDCNIDITVPSGKVVTFIRGVT